MHLCAPQHLNICCSGGSQSRYLRVGKRLERVSDKVSYTPLPSSLVTCMRFLLDSKLPAKNKQTLLRSSQSCVNRHKGLGSHSTTSLPLQLPVPNKPYGFCGCKLSLKLEPLLQYVCFPLQICSPIPLPWPCLCLDCRTLNGS